MKITSIECHVLLDPDYDVSATSSAQDDIVVVIHTDEGVTGIGEVDVNPWIARACITAPSTHSMGLGLAEMLIGRHPLEVDEIWTDLYVGSAMNGRRGAMINAMGAIDIALHDLRGKILGEPCYELLGGPVREAVIPYASLQPEVTSYEAYRESLLAWALDARARGFRAAKAEVTLAGPYAHMGIKVDRPFERTTEIVAALRDAVGPDFTLMIDVQYAFPDVDTCLATLADWHDFDIYFLETPLWPDDLAGYARLAEQPIPIASGEWLTTRFEFLQLLDQGRVRVAQPDIGRVGGLTEARRVADLARDRGLTVVPHLWKTGISIAAAVHFAAATPHCPFIEYLPADLSESALRKDLVANTPPMVDGVVRLPTAPGLGIELNHDALRRFTDAARAVSVGVAS
ncbi:MAG TPA: mandelate racemase/muconate lactonizing enzyme family protein [Chloroflexota bacterium]|nr:mandelate racemase/muconate lactonizing enzyme family protein [Chloroflexota bacterium]